MSDTNSNDGETEEGKSLRTKFERDLFRRDVEIAAMKAGLTTEGKAGQAMLDAVADTFVSKKGDLTNDALLAEAKEWGIAPSGTPAAAPSTETPTPPPAAAGTSASGSDEATAHRDANDMATDGKVPNPDDQTAHPAELGVKSFYAELESGAPEDDAAAQYFDRVIDAAGKGDQRVLVRKDSE